MRKNKFYAIYTELAEKIKSGDYKPGETLPSEHELTDTYETSRETIRKALNLLAQNGFIQKIRGKGSIVLDMQKMSLPFSGLVSFKEVAEHSGFHAETVVHEFGLMKPTESLMTKLKATPNDEIWEVIRSRRINGEHVILDKDYFLKAFVPYLSKDICEKSIYEYLEKKLNLTISFAKKEIIVEPCTEEDRKLLDVDGFDHIVVVKNYVYLDDATLFQYTESRHRLDKFRFGRLCSSRSVDGGIRRNLHEPKRDKPSFEESVCHYLI